MSGQGTVLLNNKEYVVGTGDVLELPVGCKHKNTAKICMTIMELQLEIKEVYELLYNGFWSL